MDYLPLVGDPFDDFHQSLSKVRYAYFLLLNITSMPSSELEAYP
jgi:hypothetical protein